jgi:GR25 family glycosyltransferase involved in LPS biosynthesis
MPAPLTAYFINLDRSTERAAFMQAQLSRLGLDWVQRHAAVDGAQLELPPGCMLLPGELGCVLSHLQVLQRAPADGYTLVLEDDVELSGQCGEFVGSMVQGLPDGVDIVFLECQPHVSLAHLSSLWTAASRHLSAIEAGTRRATGVDLLDARPLYKWGTGAYLLTPPGRARLLALIEGWLREGPVLPLDRCLERALQAGELRGVVSVPFLATIAPQWHRASTIGDGLRSPPPLLMVLRRLFFAGSVQEAQPWAQSLAQPPDDPALQLFGLVLREVASLQRDEARRVHDEAKDRPVA